MDWGDAMTLHAVGQVMTVWFLINALFVALRMIPLAEQ
jgi:hypothetical protein